ncbi:MAG TPA: uracil phosphoribosyltransferase [Capillimicrobium sp.]|nr:uracil phosphoribosyltransferase [Capillimicrobium sp.]
MDPRLVVVDHPVLADRIAVLRDRRTPHGAFRLALHEAAAIVAIEATRDLPTRAVDIDTPLEPVTARRLRGEVAVVPVLRAGLAMVEGFLSLLPDARVGHLGLQRDEQTLTPRGYFERLPAGLAEAHTFVLDPMLATGGSAVHALDRLTEVGARHLRLVCLVAAPEGVAAVHDRHPDVTIWTAALDRELDEHGYIRPGLGDAGDRVFGTPTA